MGYTTASDWTQQNREISVGGDGNLATSGSNAAAVNTARDRKYQMIDLYSYDTSRQPFLNVQKLAAQAGNKLAVDVFSDVIGKVITAASFASSGKIGSATWTADDIADLRETADGLYWPVAGRSLVLNHTSSRHY